MKNFTLPIFILSSLFLSFCSNDQGPVEAISPQEIVLSSIRGEKSRPFSVSFMNDSKRIKHFSVSFEGNQADFWRILSAVPEQIESGESIEIIVSFEPDSTFIGRVSGDMVFSSENKRSRVFRLRGLSTKALEGKNEPPLADVVKSLGYDIDLGWSTLANHLRPELQGSEIAQSLFKKAGAKSVEMIPVARYSPAFSLPFGYYTGTSENPDLHEIGVLSNTKDYPEHQTLFPSLESGSFSFDPNQATFGFFTTSPSHVAYSEDSWNQRLFPKHATHACRIYQAKDLSGNILVNQYLVCFEEAKNGDYQDYVFLVKNVEAIGL